MRHLDLEVVVAGRWTPKDVKATSVARLVAGDDVGEIARDAGVAEATVYEWVKQAGELPPKKALARARDQLIDDAVALVMSGMSVPDAAATLGSQRVRCTSGWRKSVCAPNYNKSPASPRNKKQTRSHGCWLVSR